MSRLGRPPKAYRTVQWSFRLPEHLAAKYDLMLSRSHFTRPITPNTRQELFVPLLERIWQALTDGQDTIYVGDILADLRSNFIPPEDSAT